MASIRISKVFSFEMAHALLNHGGKCENIHGHSYRLQVTVAGEVRAEKSHPHDGMVMDFAELKRIVEESVIRVFDHALVIHSASDEKFLKQLRQFNKNTLVVPYQPTSENLVLDFARRIMDRMGNGARLHSVRLSETASSFAEWHATGR